MSEAMIETEKNDFIKKLEGLREQVNECIRESYQLFWREREYTKVVVVPPQQTVSVFFGEEHEVAGTMSLGIPETVLKRDGLVHDFHLKHFEIEGDDIDNLFVQGVFLGQRACWASFNPVPAHRFANNNKINIDQICIEGLHITAQISNSSSVPKKVTVKIIGRERAPNPANA